jgi:predicted lipid-binding transport protein (Tim44 family)
MRKMNLLFGAMALGLGVIVGTLGVSLLTNPSSPGSFISKLRGQDSVQTVTAGVNDSTQTPPVQDDLSATNAALYNANPDSSLNQADQPIVADYKQDIGIFFGAWKSADMETFRLKLAKAYTGELFEKHARRAEEFLVQGVGLDVSQITFDQVDVESADANTATLRADYRYKARDYSLADGASFGEEHEQTVQVRVNLLKQNSRWMITGENSIQ